MVSHPETGSDSPIGSDRDRGRDNSIVLNSGFTIFEFNCRCYGQRLHHF